LKDYWYANREALLNYINLVHTTGIRGFVTDLDGNSLEGVKISVGDRTKKIKTFKDGDFWRLLVPGKYLVRAKKRGYMNSRKVIEVLNGTSTFVNFTMVPKNQPKKQVDLTSVVERSESNHAFHDSDNKGSKLKLSVDSHAENLSPTFVVFIFSLVVCFARLLS